LESLITFNEFQLNKCTLSAPTHQNISSDERTALAELIKADNIIIKPADKGSAVVIQNRDDYISEGIRQLSNTNFYVETRDNLTHLHNDLITDLIKHMHTSGEISDKCKSYLINESPRTSQLYLLPKIHKNQSPVPGRPIVSANNSPTEKISQFADFFLQPLVQTTKSYVKDTTDFINHIEALSALTENSLLCTIDVSSLYTNIPNQEGITACRNILQTHRTHSDPPSNDSIIHALEYVLYMNNFDFNGKHYLQVGGTAMGTKVAPSFANIFMADFENRFVYTYHPQPRLWLRYIDDIFMIWDHGRQSLNDFIQHLNTCHHSIKFTSEISDTSINFLDTTAKKDPDNKLYTTLYCKPTDSHSYLLYDSAHPTHLKNSLPYSQLLRIRRICSKLTDFEQHAIELCNHFLRRGYPPNIIERALIQAHRQDRESLLHPAPKPQNDFKDVFLVTTYHPTGSPLKGIVQENWPILGRNIATENLFTKKIIFGNRRNKSLKDRLVHAKIQEHKPKNTLINKQCKSKKCRYCPKLDCSGRITSTITGKTHASKHNNTCNSNNLIYCITCKICSNQYVGQTKNTIKERFKNHFHKIDYPSNPNTAVGRHFSSADHHGISDVIIHVLDFISSPSHSPSAQRTRDDLERMWMHKLVTTSPYGLNVAD
jgi:hypothetical protein